MRPNIIREGEVRLNIPLPDDLSIKPASAGAVFYNPEMELNRDISISAISAFLNMEDLEPAGTTYADVMSASGIRGIRVAKEAGVSCRLNDWAKSAFELLQHNIRLNGLEALCTASNQNANALMHREHFDIVDLDPFGSPAPYLDAAARCAGRLLCITATDTAPLCGAHLNSGIRKYAAVPLNTEYHREMGARILLGAAVRALAMQDKGVKILLTHATRHYVRTYIQIRKGVTHADGAMQRMGFISHCFNCGYRSWKVGLVPACRTECPECGKSLRYAGPLWLGSIQAPEFCRMVLDELEARKPGKWKEAKRIIELCRDEADIPTYYDQHWLCKKKKISPGHMDGLVRSLRAAGFSASRTHFSGTGFKTDAGISLIYEML